MLTVEWLRPAVDDLETILDYIADHNFVAAEELADRIIQLAESLSHHPYKGTVGRVAGTRELLVHPNYWLIYQVNDRVQIMGVLHSRMLYP